MTKIKICGITSFEDAKLVLDAGADALGFNFYHGSPRCLTPGEAQAITRRIPPSILRVGVFVNHSREEVERIARQTSVDALQFHGDETPEFCQRWRAHWKVIKAIRCKADTRLDDLKAYQSVSDHLLLDAFASDAYGGTGRSIIGEVLDSLAKAGIFANAILAGGLNPENVRAQVERFQPFGVDVASGVESAPGKKDPERVRAFVTAVRESK